MSTCAKPCSTANPAIVAAAHDRRARRPLQLSSKFQISIPKIVREEQHWEAGQEFVFIPKGKGVLVMPVPELDQLAGIAKGANKDGYRDRKDRN